MRFLMKTDYYQDIRLFKYRSTFFWYLALVIGCIITPLLLDEYLVSQMTFICMYAIAAVGLMLLFGNTIFLTVTLMVWLLFGYLLAVLVGACVILAPSSRPLSALCGLGVALLVGGISVLFCSIPVGMGWYPIWVALPLAVGALYGGLRLFARPVTV